MRLTNLREVAAFLLAQIVKMVAANVVTVFVLVPFYIGLIHGGRLLLMSTLSLGFAALMWFASFPVFLLLRAGFGGVPRLVAAPGRERAITTSGGEFGAFALTYVIDLFISALLNTLLMTAIYSALRGGGHTGLIRPVALSVAALFAVIFFVIFIGLRRAFCGRRLTTPADGDAADPALAGSTVGFGGAIAAVLRKYAVFYGRARRPEYWYWVLFQVLLGIGLAILDVLAFGTPTGVFSVAATLGFVLPNLAVTVRRLHDINASGWWVLLSFIPLFGAIALIVMACLDGSKGANRFGPEFA